MPGRPGDKDRTKAIQELAKRIEKLEADGGSLGPAGPRGPAGPAGPPGEGKTGPAGKDGRDGRGLKSAKIENGVLVFEYTDGTRQTVGRVMGPQGESGRHGRDGINGRAGTVTIEFMEGKKLLKRISDIPSGATVRQPIDRLKE